MQKVFLKDIKPSSYFGQLIAQRRNLDPHSPQFLRNVLDDFERGFLSD